MLIFAVMTEIPRYLKKNTVFYVEVGNGSRDNRVIQELFRRRYGIVRQFSNYQLRLIYVPDIVSNMNSDVMDYLLPDMELTLDTVSTENIYSRLASDAGISDRDGCYLVYLDRSIPDHQRIGTYCISSSNEDDIIWNLVTFCRANGILRKSAAQHLVADFSRKMLVKSIAEEKLRQRNPVVLYSSEDRKMAIAQMYLNEIRKLGLSPDQLRSLIVTDKPKASQLIVTEKFDIFLPDYKGGMTICMTPLMKTIYLFFLRHTEGVAIKDLPDYRTELMTIYGRVSNVSDRERQENSVEQLVHPFNNSINEKLSKIKKGFIDMMPPELAAFYYIFGSRACARKIQIDRKLVIWKKPYWE